MKIKNICLHKNKNIGKVVYFVEGEKTEIELLKYLFTNIFHYEFMSIKRKGKNKFVFCDKFQNKNNPFSQVYVINTKNSNISSVSSSEEFIDKIYRILFEDYHLEMDNASVYYIFDRDRSSNQLSIIQNLMKQFQNSQDNDIEYGGLLLLSYPAIESFIISCYQDVNNLYLSSTNYKKYVYKQRYHYYEIDENKIIHGIKQLFNGLNLFLPNENIYYNLDHFANINLSLLDKEEEYYNAYQVYYALSLLLISFIDLGLIEVEEVYE